ncbi:uncharacterized protein si:dkey-30e9.6 [Scophthalmus maximus]|uniref:uncharacterized protein si:dkey-30e9.6 n=1 Tax=Scophthalmus maximus TaxID=52904 RepID=UPI001FA8AB2A|nr:uncharacterized protein si:dkey-30e9.6 [Scophthalmus maximus]
MAPYVPQRKERKPCAIVAAPITNGTNRTAGVILPNVLHESYKRKDPPKFITSHRPPGVLESELMFVKMEKFPSEPYKNPKLHNFRPTSRSEINCRLRDTRTRMDTYKPAEPKWDARLILPQPPWPSKSASYTRHRRRRGTYSAFLDRVEEKLSRSWKNRL